MFGLFGCRMVDGWLEVEVDLFDDDTCDDTCASTFLVEKKAVEDC